MPRIAYGGFQHETNTFAPTPADFGDFVLGGGWPGICSGAAIWPALVGTNIPAAGFVQAALDAGDTVVPTTWCAASPSAHVTMAAYEEIAGMILRGIQQALPVDAVYLDLHGAMVAQHLDDGEGELLARVRQLVGPAVPVIASLDLHANVTRQMLAQADALVAFRTYPHVDMAETGRRAYAVLRKRLAFGRRLPLASRALDYLIPTCWQCTDIEPARSLYALLEQLERSAQLDPSEPSVDHISFTPGFPAADFPECAPVVWSYAETQQAADAAVDQLARAVAAAEPAFAGKLYTPDEAVLHAMALAQVQAPGSTQPVIIADAQDNPGAGSNSDTTGMLRALLRHGAHGAALGLMVDPAAARLAHAAGEGRTVRLRLGGNAGLPDDAPFEGDFFIERLHPGEFDATGPYFGGFRLNVGAAACLRIAGVRVVLASCKVQMADQAMFRFIGIEPQSQRILVVKSAVHFRADFAAIAGDILLAAAPGAMPMVIDQLPWTRLAPQMRLGPGGRRFVPPAGA